MPPKLRRQGTDFPLEPLSYCGLADTLILDFQPPGLERIHFFCFKLPSLSYFITAILGDNTDCFTFMKAAAAAAAKSLQSCLTLCDPLDGSPLGSSVPGMLQARILEWVAISFSNAWKWKVKVKSLSRLLATPWTATYQVPLSMGFSRQEYWSGVPLLSPNIYTTMYKIDNQQGPTV